jgi:phosphoglycolate phosphatase
MAHVFLDLDGTLIDPWDGTTRSIAFAMAQIGQPLASDTDLRFAIGPPLWDSFRALGVGADRLDAAVAAYRSRYARIGRFEARLYTGVPETLADLATAGHVLCLATSKPGGFAEMITEHFGISRYLSHQFGSELDGRRSDKSDLLAHALKMTGAIPAHSVMVGDRRFDIAGARANGIAAIGASWGYGAPGELADAGADRLADTPGALPGAIAEWLSARSCADPARRVRAGRATRP